MRNPTPLRTETPHMSIGSTGFGSGRSGGVPGSGAGRNAKAQVQTGETGGPAGRRGRVGARLPARLGLRLGPPDSLPRVAPRRVLPNATGVAIGLRREAERLIQGENGGRLTTQIPAAKNLLYLLLNEPSAEEVAFVAEVLQLPVPMVAGAVETHRLLDGGEFAESIFDLIVARSRGTLTSFVALAAQCAVSYVDTLNHWANLDSGPRVFDEAAAVLDRAMNGCVEISEESLEELKVDALTGETYARPEGLPQMEAAVESNEHGLTIADRNEERSSPVAELRCDDAGVWSLSSREGPRHATELRNLDGDIQSVRAWRDGFGLLHLDLRAESGTRTSDLRLMIARDGVTVNDPRRSITSSVSSTRTRLETMATGLAAAVDDLQRQLDALDRENAETAFFDPEYFQALVSVELLDNRFALAEAAHELAVELERSNGNQGRAREAERSAEEIEEAKQEVQTTYEQFEQVASEYDRLSQALEGLEGDEREQALLALEGAYARMEILRAVASDALERMLPHEGSRLPLLVQFRLERPLIRSVAAAGGERGLIDDYRAFIVEVRRRFPDEPSAAARSGARVEILRTELP